MPSAQTFTDPAIHDASVGIRKEEESAEQEKDDEKKAKIYKRECHAIQMDILALLSRGVAENAVTEKDRTTYMEAMQFEKLEAQGADSWEKKKEWLEGNLKKYVPKFLREANSMIGNFLRDIEKAERNEWITKNSADRWRDRLVNRSTLWNETKDFLQNFNTKYMANWEKLAKKKREVLDTQKRLKVGPKEIPALAPLQDQAFDEKNYKERAPLIDKVLVALALYEANNQKLYQLHTKAESMLYSGVKSRVLREDQATEWLESLFNRKRPPEAIESILKGTLSLYMSNWTKVRFRYDLVRHRMHKGIPPGSKRLDEKAFLNLSYPEKESYVTEAEYALDLIDKGFSNRPIDKMKLEIRSLMAQKDWEGAAAVLKDARKIAEGKDVYELNAMEAEWKRLSAQDVHIENDASESGHDTLQEIRDILHAEVPSSVRDLYIKALTSGPQVFSSLCTLLFNRVWCWDNGYLDAERELQLRNAAKEETKTIVEQGHRDRGLENIDMDIVDESNKSKTMRPYKSTWAPTVMHMDASDGGSCGALVNELQGKEPARDYWSSLVLKNIPYEKQREIVTNVHHRLKSSIRKLHAKGMSFNLVGPPTSQN